MFLPVPPRPDPEAKPTGAPVPKALTQAVADEEADLRAVVGPNADFYLASWRQAAAGRDGGFGFNRAAFFLSYFWLGYRRMYWPAVGLFAIMLAESLLEELVFCVLLGFERPPIILGLIVGFTLAVVCGACANRWYLAHVRQVISDVRRGNPDEPVDRAALRARGGTSFAGGLVVVALCLMSAFMLGATLAVLHLIVIGE